LIIDLTTRIAQILSATLHPLLMPTIIFAIIFYIAPEAISNLDVYNNSILVGKMSLKIGLLLLIFLQTFIVPCVMIYYLYRFRLIKSLKMETLQDRRLPYLITIVIYTAIAAFYTYSLKQFPEIALIITSIAFSIAIVTVISLYWKISAHAVGISGMVGALFGVMIKYQSYSLAYPVIISIIVGGFLLSARLHLNAHTPLQIIAGTILGLTISILVVGL
jgi:membrane-associated phospholipid phosphatase